MSTPRRRPSLTSPQQELLDAIQSILPAAHSRVLPLLVAEPPLREIAPIVITPCKAPFLKPLKPARTKETLLTPSPILHWQREFLLAASNAHLAFVLEGTADFEIGFTAQQAKSAGLDRSHSRYWLRVPAGCGVLFPPYIAHSDGHLPHWHPADNSESGDDAFSRLLWIGTLPEGAICHTCITRGKAHQAGARNFVLHPQLQNLGELLMDELRRPDSAVAPLLLAAMLMIVERELRTGQATADESGLHVVAAVSAHDAAPNTQTAADTTLRRALLYIENHLDQPLTTTKIATHCYVSASHLNRLFQKQHGQSLMKFVENHRVQAAQSLLINTNLPVSTIGRHVGYTHLPQFSLVFKRVCGQSPSQYRQNRRS